MIGYVTLGSNDLEKSAAFFDGLLPHLGGARAYSLMNMVAYGFGQDKPLLILTMPHDTKQATNGNGTMVALMAKDRNAVDVSHASALALGATNEGAPGPRGRQFYGAYFRDLDGNKFCVFVNG